MLPDHAESEQLHVKRNVRTVSVLMYSAKQLFSLQSARSPEELVKAIAMDPNANAEYRKANDVLFAVGQQVWVTGIEFMVVGITPISPQVPNGQLILAPVTAKV